jgi:carbamoyltransferase
MKSLGADCAFRYRDDFLGPEYDLGAVRERVSRHPGLLVTEPKDYALAVARELETGRVVALYQQRSESGPRALGHRSILACPRYEVTRNYINQHIKHRAWFRPLAPMVLAEAASSYFDSDRPSPFMLQTAKVLPQARERLAAVCHANGSARLQTVSAESNPLVAEILGAFRGLTGLPVLLNTSFNGAGEAIVETPDEAVACFERLPIHVLAIGGMIIHKRDEPPHPLRT